MEESDATQVCLPLPLPEPHVSISAPLYHCFLSNQVDSCCTMSLPPPTPGLLPASAALPDDLQLLGKYNAFESSTAHCLSSCTQPQLHMDSSSDRVLAADASCQLDWQGLPHEWGGATSASPAALSHLTGSDSYDFLDLSGSSDVSPSCPSSNSGVILTANSFVPAPSLQSILLPNASCCYDSMETSSIASATSSALLFLEPEATPYDSGGAPLAQCEVAYPASVSSPVEASSCQSATAPRWLTRSKAAAAAASSNAASCQPPTPVLSQTRRKRGRPRLYDTITPVRNAGVNNLTSSAE